MDDRPPASRGVAGGHASQSMPVCRDGVTAHPAAGY